MFRNIIFFYEDIFYQAKVTDTLEIVGFAYRQTLPEDDIEDEHIAHLLRIHAVSVKPLLTSNPLCFPSINTDEIFNKALELRSELHLALTQLLLGDHLAADYFICHFLARVHSRQDVVVLGKLSINLCLFPAKIEDPEYTSYIYQVISKLIPKTHYFPMTLQNMNTIDMLPKKDYRTGRLSTGRLQLSSKTHLVVDETKLQTGKLEEKGVRNVQALKDLIENQRLMYDFQYYNKEFEADIPVLIISEGKSILPSDFRIMLKADSSCIASQLETLESVLSYLREPLLSKLRLYLTVMSMADFELPENLQHRIQDDFVKLRQGSSTVSADDLHALLVLARWLTLSYGKKTLTEQIWQKASQMEEERKKRII